MFTLFHLILNFLKTVSSGPTISFFRKAKVVSEETKNFANKMKFFSTVRSEEFSIKKLKLVPTFEFCKFLSFSKKSFNFLSSKLKNKK